MFSIKQSLHNKKPKVGKVTFVAVDGHGGSGKSSLAKLLSVSLNAEIIHTDDFASFDNPLQWHSLLIEKVFQQITLGAKEVSYDRSKWWDTHYPEPVKGQEVTDIMILEGVSALRREFRDYISLGIFVDTPREICIARGIERDLQTGKPIEEITKLWTKWIQDEDAYFKRDTPKEYADIAVDGTKPFEEQISF